MGKKSCGMLNVVLVNEIYLQHSITHTYCILSLAHAPRWDFELALQDICWTWWDNIYYCIFSSNDNLDLKIILDEPKTEICFMNLNLVSFLLQDKVIGVLDWELSTLGNQMCDVAYSSLVFSKFLFICWNDFADI